MDEPCEARLSFRPDNFDDFFEILEELGSGQFAVVRRVVEKSSGIEFAGKFIRKRRFASSRRGVKRSDIEREVEVLREVGGHPNVISLKDVFETPTTVILVLQLVSGGELFDHVCRKERLKEREAAAFLRQILLGVAHLHARHVVHLDLKPENVMLSSRWGTEVKLIDFGLSRRIPPGAVVKDMIGTPEFVAPEIVAYNCLSPATDMWAVGVITYILLSGASPFLGNCREETFCNITSANYNFEADNFDNVSELAKDFIRALFVKDQKRRATVDECLQHPFIAWTGKMEEAVETSAVGPGDAELNLASIRSFAIRRRWKQAIRAVMVCNQLVARARRLAEERPKELASRKSHYLPETLAMSALLCAAEEGNVEGLEELLLNARLDLNVANQLGETAVHMAAGSGQGSAVRFLVTRGAAPDAADRHGESALFWAARAGAVPEARFLLDEGADLHRRNKSGETALHVGVRYGQMGLVQLLLSLGADTRTRDDHGETPLHIAAWHGFALLLHLLCQGEPDLAVKNKESESALHCAAARGHLECVQSLVEAGAPLDAPDKNGETPLHLALRRQHMDIALLLLSKSCGLNPADGAGNTPLHVACAEGLLTAAQTLCHLGADTDIRNKKQQSPLHIAAREGQAEIVRTLCLAGADIEVQNKEGLTPEILALAEGNSTVGDLLAKLKTPSARAAFAEQLGPGPSSLRRIKLKLFGHSGVGKSRLLAALQTGALGRVLGGLTRRWSEAGSSQSGREEESGEDSARLNTLDHSPAHPAYTRGIDVHTLNVPGPRIAGIAGVGEVSGWEFGGYEPYQTVYDHFVGNVDCVHGVVVNAGDPMETVYAQLLYWLNFLKGRIMPTEPIGHCGSMCRRSRVVVVATHADAAASPLGKIPGSEELFSEELSTVLGTLAVRFGTDFEMHPRLILIDGTSPNCSGLKALKAYLGPVRNEILAALPKSTGFLEAALTYLVGLRKAQAAFPVLSWPRLVQLLRNEVNPLAGESQCRQLIQQLQLMGEVVYLKGDAAEMDYVVLSVDWLCGGVIGQLLSAENLRRCRPDGCCLADEFHLSFPEVPDVLDLLQLLDALQLCTVVDASGAVEYEFPALNFGAAPPQLWEREEGLLYGGLRIQAPHGCERGFTSIFPRLQVQLRRSMQEFQDPVDAELLQWQWVSRMASGLMEGLVELRRAPAESASRQDAIEITVRGPREAAASCFYFLEDLAQLAEQTLSEVAPGLPLERHFLSPKDLALHELNPAVYPPEAVMAMQQKESISLTNNKEESEPFTDVVCFGSRDVAMALTLGIDLPVAQLQLSARRELAALLDPPESLGRDWSILAVRLGLAEALPEVDSSGPVLSRTDQLLGEWSLRSPGAATVGTLCDVLGELGRADTVTALFKLVPLYMFAPLEEPEEATAATAATDSGVASGTNSNSSHRSCSTLSR